MSLDLRLELFAYDLFRATVSKEKSKAKGCKASDFYYEECRDFEHVFHDSYLPAVTCIRLFYHRVYVEEICKSYHEISTSISDIYIYINKTCDREDLFGGLTVFERLLATCAFVSELCNYCFHRDDTEFIKFAHFGWTMYFDKYSKEFNENGGWEKLEKVATLYTPVIEFVAHRMEGAGAIPERISEIARAVSDYENFRKCIAYEARAATRSWILCRLEKYQSESESICFNEKSKADIELLLQKLRTYCFHGVKEFSKVTKWTERIKSILNSGNASVRDISNTKQSTCAKSVSLSMVTSEMLNTASSLRKRIDVLKERIEQSKSNLLAELSDSENSSDATQGKMTDQDNLKDVRDSENLLTVESLEQDIVGGTKRKYGKKMRKESECGTPKTSTLKGKGENVDEEIVVDKQTRQGSVGTIAKETEQDIVKDARDSENLLAVESSDQDIVGGTKRKYGKKTNKESECVTPKTSKSEGKGENVDEAIVVDKQTRQGSVGTIAKETDQNILKDVRDSENLLAVESSDQDIVGGTKRKYGKKMRKESECGTPKTSTLKGKGENVDEAIVVDKQTSSSKIIGLDVSIPEMAENAASNHELKDETESVCVDSQTETFEDNHFNNTFVSKNISEAPLNKDATVSIESNEKNLKSLHEESKTLSLIESGSKNIENVFDKLRSSLEVLAAASSMLETRPSDKAETEQIKVQSSTNYMQKHDEDVSPTGKLEKAEIISKTEEVLDQKESDPLALSDVEVEENIKWKNERNTYLIPCELQNVPPNIEKELAGVENVIIPPIMDKSKTIEQLDQTQAVGSSKIPENIMKYSGMLEHTENVGNGADTESVGVDTDIQKKASLTDNMSVQPKTRKTSKRDKRKKKTQPLSHEKSEKEKNIKDEHQSKVVDKIPGDACANTFEAKNKINRETQKSISTSKSRKNQTGVTKLQKESSTSQIKGDDSSEKTATPNEDDRFIEYLDHIVLRKADVNVANQKVAINIGPDARPAKLVEFINVICDQVPEDMALSVEKESSEKVNKNEENIGINIDTGDAPKTSCASEPKKSKVTYKPIIQKIKHSDLTTEDSKQIPPQAAGEKMDDLSQESSENSGKFKEDPDVLRMILVLGDRRGIQYIRSTRMKKEEYQTSKKSTIETRSTVEAEMSDIETAEQTD